tara:strand:+ start:55 stop:813 length:759 start_codon:yes stop_codon:yes gene_type:complete
MKTRIFMGLKNIDYTGHHINLQKKENFSPYFQGVTPRSLVPVLVDDGEVHIESNDILEYLDKKFPATRLIPPGKEEEINNMMIEENNLHIDIRNVTFKFLVPKFLNNVKIQEKSKSKATLHGGKDSEDDVNRKFWENYKKEGISDEVATKSLSNLKLHLDEIDEKLSHHTYILGNELTLPDIAWFIYVSRLKAARYPIHILHPNVNDWFESLLKREVFAKEIKIPGIVRFISYIFYVVQKYSGWSIKRQLVG